MSNPEKMKVDNIEEEKADSDEQWSDEESDMREIVLALPALRISSERFGVSSVVEGEEEEEEEARLNQQAVVAAKLVIAAAEEAVMKEKNDGKKKKKWTKPRKMKKLEDIPGGSGKGVVESSKKTKKTKKKGSELTNQPKGPPVCHICGKGFGSWKGVFGHMRCHKDRNYQGFLPPPKFSAVSGGFSIPGPNSAFVLVTAGGGRSGGFVTAGGGGTSGGEGGRDLGIDLNVDLVEEEDQEMNEVEAIAKFDLNKSPPKDEEDEENAE